jgi:hypothetical protein
VARLPLLARQRLSKSLHSEPARRLTVSACLLAFCRVFARVSWTRMTAAATQPASASVQMKVRTCLREQHHACARAVQRSELSCAAQTPPRARR